MRSDRVRHVQVQMDSDNVLGRGAIRDAGLEAEPIDVQPIARLSSLCVERKERLADGIRMR
jgi:hypothetical protein